MPVLNWRTAGAADGHNDAQVLVLRWHGCALQHVRDSIWPAQERSAGTKEGIGLRWEWISISSPAPITLPCQLLVVVCVHN